MACRTCMLKSACKHFKGVCPWLVYMVLAAAVGIPSFLLLRG